MHIVMRIGSFFKFDLKINGMAEVVTLIQVGIWIVLMVRTIMSII